MRHDGPGDPMSFEGWHWVTCKACRDCVHGFCETSDDNTPMKANCKIYPYGSGRAKPVDILMNGAPCDFYEKHPKPPSYWIPGENSILDYDI